jgi:hypothetical protein
MKKITILHIVLIALTVLSLTSVAAKDGLHRFTAVLTGEAEVNAQGEPNQGDLDGKGLAKITINFGQGTLCWDIFVSRITLPASASHIHAAPAGVNGPIVVNFTAPDASGSSSGCTSVSRDLLKAIIEHPENYYVNVHNSDFPSGAMRGQLSQ